MGEFDPAIRIAPSAPLTAPLRVGDGQSRQNNPQHEQPEEKDVIQLHEEAEVIETSTEERPLESPVEEPIHLDIAV